MKTLHVRLAAPAAPDATATLAGPADGRESNLTRVAALARAPAPASGPSGSMPGPRATAILIDVLRATTTLSVAKYHGASRVIAAESVREARELKARHPEALLCGERDGRILPGFDLGNSPFEYTRERVENRLLIFASTNGSQSLKLAASARRRVLGAFVSASAVVERVAADAEVWIVAAGRLGQPSLEDLACAGWIARALAVRGFRLASPSARLVSALAPPDAAGVRALVEGASHARALCGLGPAFARDVGYCATLDALNDAYEV
ncbi:MAG: 2-phosphosulfolactate phosphatase [Candidatus Eisenbacteria bacterium]